MRLTTVTRKDQIEEGDYLLIINRNIKVPPSIEYVQKIEPVTGSVEIHFDDDRSIDLSMHLDGMSWAKEMFIIEPLR